MNAPAPDFTLRDLSGAAHRLSQHRGKIVILNFWSAECPWSRRGDAILAERLAGWASQGVRVWGIASNASEPESKVRAEIEERQVPYPILLDPGNVVADLYGAAATPHFFVVDAEGVVRYAGALDDARFRSRQPKAFYLADAIAAVLAGRPPKPAETQAYGCAIIRATPSALP